MIEHKPPQLDELIDFHLQRYEDREKENIDRARAWHRGDFWDSMEGAEARSAPEDMRAEKNLVHAITETAVSQLLGPNPQFAAIPQNIPSQDSKGLAEGLMRYCARKANFRRKAALALTDAVHCSRGIFKTTWNSRKDHPEVHVINPANLFFDPEARDIDQISYWLECTPISVSAYNKKVGTAEKPGIYYPNPDAGTGHSDDIKPEGAPAWAEDETHRTSLRRYRQSVKKVLVWEFYDLESNRVIHYHRSSKRILAQFDRVEYVPYSMFTLIHNGVDCHGKSEVQLILNPQKTLNQLLTLWKSIAYLQVPKILFDAGKISSDVLNQAMQADLSQFIPVEADDTDQVRNFGAMFYEVPRVEMPQVVIEYIAKLENDAAWQSALLEAARGQVTGAKTATEMQFIKSEQRNRLSTREGHLATAMSDVAKKMFYLTQRFMRAESLVRVAGQSTFVPVGVSDLKGLDMDFEVVQYQAMQQNPALVMETMQRMIPLLAQAPNIDMIKLFEELIKGLGLPHRILIPEETVIAQQQQAAQQQQQAAQMELERAKGGAAVKDKEPEVTGPAGGAQMAGDAARQSPELQAAIRRQATQVGMSPPASPAEA